MKYLLNYPPQIVNKTKGCQTGFDNWAVQLCFSWNVCKYSS